jgi:transposase
LVFLPAYSPELNPCELIFGYVKNKLRREGIQNLLDDAIIAFDSVELEMMINFYRKCLYPDQILPDIHLEM